MNYLFIHSISKINQNNLSFRLKNYSHFLKILFFLPNLINFNLLEFKIFYFLIIYFHFLKMKYFILNYYLIRLKVIFRLKSINLNFKFPFYSYYLFIYNFNKFPNY